MTNNIIQYLNNIIQNAINQKASDIHFEPYQNLCRIRFRVDGLLREIETLEKNQFEAIISRIKVLAHLNIAEKRLPQDGHFLFDPTHHIRVSSCPTCFGEKMTLRLLDEHSTIQTIDELGFSASQKTIFLKAICKSQGLILITGPTGSGKSTTLYTAIDYLNQQQKNIVTVEDPIERQMNGINQTQIHPQIGLTFSKTLHSLLRQDPDIIMIGEIRDRETAEIAINAVQTGHLVFATLHTRSAIQTVERLQSLKLDPLQIKHSLDLITAQRLLRKLCNHCKKPVHHQEKMIYEAKGCNHCFQGYSGRIAVHELVQVDYDGRPNMMNTLKDSAMQKIFDGKTTFAEMNRVLN